MVSSEYSLETYLKGYVEANTLTQCCFCFCLKRKKIVGASQIVLLNFDIPNCVLISVDF